MSMSSHSASSRSSSTSQPNCLDPLDALIDFSDYDQVSYRSPSISPAASAKSQFVRPVASTPTANNALLPSSQQTLSAPSHNYNLYKQQTGIPAGEIQNTLALNNSNMYSFNSGYMSGLSPADDLLDFGSAPNPSFNSLEMELEFDSPSTEPAFFYPEQSMAAASDYVNPSAVQSTPTQATPASTSNVGRLWPGMHQQQAALAKAQQQQRQQQQLIQQQRQQNVAPASKQRSKSHQATDPIVEEKISQLLNSMRHGSVSTSADCDESQTPSASAHAHRLRKEEEDMDEDERLLASEEGKKLSSKERRQLRNKVSARAFRSRRKEYIGQLEGEIATKVNENSDLRAENRALLEENTRLSDLTRMLLSSPSFSGFLDTLTTNGAAAPQQQQQQQAASASAPAQEAPVENRLPKDVSTYAAQQQMQNQHVSMAILPDHNIDFSMLDFNVDGGYSYQPQVFSVREMPQVAIDTSVLSGKSSNFVGSTFESDDEKIEMPIIERRPVKGIAPIEVAPVVDEEFDADPTFTLFSQPASSTSTESVSELELAPIFGGIEPEKALARIELFDATECEVREAVSIARVERLYSSLDDMAARLESMTIHL